MNTPPQSEPVPEWDQDLYAGAAGIALAHIEDAHAGLGSWDTAHQRTAVTVRGPVSAHPGCGLHRGAPAVAFTLHAAGQRGYAHALAILDEHITTLARHRLRRARERIDARLLPALREYDLIRGLTGIGAYLLHRHTPTTGPTRPTGATLLQEVLAYLVRLTQPLTLDDGTTVPGWWTGNAPNDVPSSDWPGGHGNLGIAHGITGPLALLSLAVRRCVTVPGQTQAIERICAWLDQWQTGTGTTAWWPELISRPEHHSGMTEQAGPGRPSWCYGTPGIVRAQQLAAFAIDDPRRRRRAEQALVGCVADQDQLAQLADVSLCHGWAGLVHTTWRVAADASDPDQFDVRQLLDRTRRSVHDNPPATDMGLLTGVAGTRLALQTVTVDIAPVSGWDTCLLLDAGRPEPATPTLTDQRRADREATHGRNP